MYVLSAAPSRKELPPLLFVRRCDSSRNDRRMNSTIGGFRVEESEVEEKSLVHPEQRQAGEGAQFPARHSTVHTYKGLGHG